MIDEVQEFYCIPTEKIKLMSLFRLKLKYKNLKKIKDNNNKFLANEIGKMVFGEKESEKKEKNAKPLTDKEVKKFNKFQKDKKGLMSLFNEKKKVYKKFLKEL